MVSYAAFFMVGLSLCSADSHFMVYFILYYWGNQDSLTIASICLYTLRSGSIVTATADPPYTKQ